MSQSYEEMYQESLQELPPLDQVIIDNNLVSAFTKKLISTTRSAEEQIAILKERGLQKQLDIADYLEGTIISSPDADSGIYKDANGDIRNYRFADLNPIDAIDKEKARLNSAYKSRLQPKFVSALTGKPIEQLENSDYDNVARYQHIQEQSAFLNKDYTFTPYNKDQIYDTPKSTTMPFAYKVIGKDSNGRDLIEAINPATGRQVSFDMSNNPYLNASFDLYKSIDSEYNRDRLEKYQTRNSDQLQRIKEAFDTDGRLKENLDIVQSSAYQSAARLLQHLPDSIVDEKKWESVANANTGQQLADAWAGVKTSTRKDFAKGMIEASNEFGKGNYADAVIGWGSQLDRLLAESATQMGLMAAGTVLTGGLAAEAGIAAKIGAAFLGAVPAGIDKTLNTMEQYKANNQGREMDGEEVAKAFALNTATLIPEAFLMGINFTKLLPKSVGNSLVKTYASTASNLSRLETVVHSTIGEALQEGLEGATENWLAQDQTKSKSFTEHLLSADTAKEAIIGGMMGGVMSGTANVTGAVLSSIPTSRLNKNIEKVKEQYNTYTPTGSTANPEASAIVTNVVESTPIESTTTDVANAKIQELQKTIADNPNANTAAIDKAKATQIEIAKQALLDEKNIIDRDSFLQAIGKNKEELFEEIVLYSGLGRDKATVVRQDGKQYDDVTTKAVKEELYKVAEKLGIDKETANKSMELVDYEVKHGVNGYLHFKEQIDNISSKLKDTSLSSEERANLEAKRTAWSTRLSFLYNNQLDKLKKFAEHAAILEGGNTTSSAFTYKSGDGGFNLKSEYLASKEFGTGYGSHGVVQKVYEQAKALKDIISSLPENVIKELSTIPNKDISIDLTNDSLDTYLESYKKSSDNIFKGVEERATKRLETKPLTDKTVISKLKSLTSDKLSPSGRAKLEGEVRASLSKQESSIRDYINNSTIKEEVKSNITKELDRIKGVKETVDTRITEVQSKEEKELQIANDFSIEVADNIIKTIDKKDIPELQKEILKVASPLRTHKSKEANTLLQVYREVYSELNDRLKEAPIEDVKEDSSTVEDTTVSTTEEETNVPSKEEVEALAEMEKEVVKEDTQQVDNIKDYASNVLLDPDTNNSVTFLPRFFTEQGKSFDLRNEIKLSRSPASKIATVGADNSYVNKIKSVMSKIFLNLEFKKEEDGRVSKIVSSLSYFTKSADGGYLGMWKEAPHLRLIYNFITEGNNITFEPNDNVIAAIDLSLKEFFSINGKETFNPSSMTKGNLVGMYGYNSSTVTDEQYLQIRDVVTKYGIPRAKLEGELGSLILDNLGLRQNISNGNFGFFERVTQGLGMFAIQYAKELDYVTETVFDSDAWSEEVLERTGEEVKHAVKYNTPHIKFNTAKASRIIDEFSGIKNKEGKRTGGLKDKYKLKDTLATKPRMSKQQLPSDMTVRGTKGIMNIPPYVKKVLQKLWNTPYTVNIDLVKLVLQNKKAILARLDYMEDYKSNTDLTYDEVISQEGINAGIDREFKKLMEISKASVIAEKLGKASKFYFNWFMSKNMRIFMDTSEANPQVGKSLQRFLIMPEAINRSYRIEATTKEEQVELHNDQVVLYTAIAQAFDSMKSEERITLLGQALEKFTLEELKELQSEVINKDTKEWDKKYSELYEYKGKKYGLEGLENLGHALLVLQHLIKVQEAKKPIILIPIGTSGSGKSTWVKSLKNKYTIISPDEMRVEFTGNMNDKSKDKEIYEEVKKRTIDAVNNGSSVIIDTTNLQKDRRRDFINAVKGVLPTTDIKYHLLPLDPELAKARIKKDIEAGVDRANVPESTIDRHAILYKEALIDIQKESIIPFKGENVIESYLAVENDSTTSGYLLRMLAFPDPTILENFAAKVGILRKGSSLPMTTIHDLKDTEGFYDTYKTMAKLAYANLEGITDNFYTYEYNGKVVKTKYLDNFKPKYDKTDTKEESREKRIQAEIFTNIYLKMNNALPKPEEDGSIGSALRKLLKPPAVIFGYTAGREAVSKGVANDIMWDFIKTYMKIKSYDSLEAYIEENKIKESEQSKLKSIYSTMTYIERSVMDDNETLYTQLKKKSVTEIWLYVGNFPITLNNLFEELLVPTYGNAIWKALSNSFGNHSKFNDSMNMMFTHMFRLFEKEFNKGMSKLTDTYGADIPLTEERNVIESLFDLFPTVRLVYSNNVNESMMLMDTEKYRNANPKDKKYKVTSPISKDGITESTTSAANVRRFINAGKAGAVIPIHTMEGMVMAMVLDKYPNIIPVHDAIVMSAKDNKKITQEYNKLAFLLAKDFNLYDEITKRYLEVLKAYDKRNGETGDVYKEQLVDAYGKKQNIDKDTPLLTKDFIKNIFEYNTENINNRNKFYSEPVFISNMDGIEGSGIIVEPHEHLDDLLFKQALDTWEGWSNPETYRTDNDITYRLQQANVDVKERVALFDDLQTMSEETGNKVENKSHLDYLKDMVSKINPIHINKLVVEYSKSQDFNVGMLKGDVVTIGFDNKTEIDNITRLSPFSDKSPAEIYAHELVHASIRYAFANKKLYGFNKEINQLMTLQKAASKVTTWEDFMPTKYDTALQSVYEKHAKDLWNYIFNNPDTTSLRGLHEFVAHGLTNEVLMDKLKNNYIVSKNTGANDKLLDKLLTIVRSIFDVVFGKEKFSVAFDVASEILKGNIPILYKKTLFKELEILTSKITQANTKASDKLFEQPLKFVEMLFGLVGKGVLKGNSVVSPIVKYTLNLADNLGYPKGWQVYAETSKLDRVKALANITAFALISEARRKALPTWLREVLGLSQQGVIQTIFREVSEPDKQTSRLDQLSTLTRMVEQTSKGLETIAMFDLLNKFDKKELTLEESTSLTTILLQTDLSSLLEYDEENKTSNIDSILELINDKHKLNSSIEELENILMKDKNGIPYVNQSLALAYYMTTGKGNSALLLNAHNIAMNRLSNNPINTTEETINSIDKLTSLYALRMTTNEHRITISNLKKEGIENYLITHKNFVKDSLNGIEVEDNKGVRKTVRTLESIHTIKGYHKQLLDTSFDIEVDFLGNEEERRKEGFFIIKDGKTNITLEENPVTGMNDLVVYKRTFATPNRRDGSGFISIGAKAKGATLKESTNEILAYKKNVSYEEISDRHRVYYKKATSLLKQMNNRMNNNILSLSEIKRMSKESGAYIPILSPLGHDNGVSDFRITMSHAFKIKHLGMDLNGLKILSKMYATQNTKAYASIKNKELVSFLKRDMENNMNPTTRKDTEGHRYILLARSTDNKFLQDAWDFIPKELKDEVKKGHFFVREDWLQDLLGVPSTSLNELEVVNKLAPTQVKRGIAIGEYIMKMIAYMAKQNDIIRVPAVLVGNLVSNFNYSVANGSNPFKVFKKTMENTRNIRDYMDNKKELNIIQFRKRLGTATEKELNQINWYLAKLEHNPIHSLMQKGMYQAIVEDINTDELESIGKINQFIKNSKLSKYVPASIRWISKQLYMTEGTAIYDFMFQITQYSDFVARATEYQLKMEKAPTKYKETIKDGKKVKVITEEYLNYEEALTIDIWSAFINYDKPQSTVEQYLNDIGILMFTKYFKRIQHMIVKGIVDNPIGVMAFLFTQSFLHNPEHIYEQNVFNKSVLSLFRSPVDNFVNAVTPIPMQYYLGMRKLSL